MSSFFFNDLRSSCKTLGTNLQHKIWETFLNKTWWKGRVSRPLAFFGGFQSMNCKGYSPSMLAGLPPVVTICCKCAIASMNLDGVAIQLSCLGRTFDARIQSDHNWIQFLPLCCIGLTSSTDLPRPIIKLFPLEVSWRPLFQIAFGLIAPVQIVARKSQLYALRLSQHHFIYTLSTASLMLLSCSCCPKPPVRSQWKLICLSLACRCIGAI